MFIVRPAGQRGRFDHGWLQTAHTFSFARYHDPAHMGFRALRVINEDVIAPDTGFGTHPHQDMEILTWVVSGALEHRDSMGHAEVLRAGMVQRMTAGTGLTHSEANPDPDTPTHLLQIWLLPSQRGRTPSYQDAVVDDAVVRGRWGVIAAREGGVVHLPQGDRLLAARLDAGGSLPVACAADRHLWLQVVRGAVVLGDLELAAGDGVRASGPVDVPLAAREDAELLLFDLE